MLTSVDSPTDPESTQMLFQRYVGEGKLERLLELYEPDGAIIQKDHHVVSGIEAIREHLAGLLLLKPKLQSTIVKKIQVADIAMLFSQWRLTGTSPSGLPIESTGNSFDVVRRQSDGTWRIAIDSPHGIMP